MATIYLKHMVCPRCIYVVEQQLQHLQISYKQVLLGRVEMQEMPAPGLCQKLRRALEAFGFEWLENPAEQLVESVKTALILRLQKLPVGDGLTLKQFLKTQFGGSLNKEGRQFKAETGMSIEAYYMRLRVEKAKELLSYGQLNVNEIAWHLGFSHVQHLSAQFHKQFGISPSKYRAGQGPERTSLTLENAL